MPTVILDAGHGGNDIGIYYNNRLEKDDNLRLTLRVGEILEEYGADVEYTRQEDIYLSQFQRAEIANQKNGDLLVSIHRLSGPNVGNRPGLSFYVDADDPVGIKAAHNIGDQLADIGYAGYGIIIRSELPLLRNTDIPAVMLSVGFMETEEGNELFDRNFEETAQGIAQGIVLTLSEETTTEINSLCQRCSDPASKKDGSAPNYFILVGPFQNYETAVVLQYRVNHLGYPARIMEWRHQYLLKAGTFALLDDATILEKILRDSGFSTLISRD